MENKIALTFLRPDEDTGNFIYKGSDKKLYISIDGVIHDVTEQGEPIGPVYNTYVKQNEPIYNPEDRFGRNPGSKLQTESKKSLKQFIKEEVKRLQKITLLEESKTKIEQKLKLLKEDFDFDSEAPQDEPDSENDCFIEDKPSGGYDVSCSGEFIGNFEDIDVASKEINAWMNKNNYFPSIWFISDHGNVSPYGI